MMQEKVTRYFDEQAAGYHDKYETVDDMRSFIFSERKALVLEMLGGSYDRMLDIGCGPGVYTDKLAERSNNLYGVDISEEMIAIAKKKGYPNAVFSVGGIEKMEFGDNFFDAVVCVGVLEYLNDIDAAVKEVARVAKKDAVIIFTAPNASSILNKLDHMMRSVLKAFNKYIKIDMSKSFMNYDFQPRLISKKELEPILKKYGLKVEERRFHIFRLSFLNRLSSGLSLFLAKHLNFISSRFLAINYIVKARKINAAL